MSRSKSNSHHVPTPRLQNNVLGWPYNGNGFIPPQTMTTRTPKSEIQILPPSPQLARVLKKTTALQPAASCRSLSASSATKRVLSWTQGLASFLGFGPWPSSSSSSAVSFRCVTSDALCTSGRWSKHITICMQMTHTSLGSPTPRQLINQLCVRIAKQDKSQSPLPRRQSERGVRIKGSVLSYWVASATD